MADWKKIRENDLQHQYRNMKKKGLYVSITRQPTSYKDAGAWVFSFEDMAKDTPQKDFVRRRLFYGGDEAKKEALIYAKRYMEKINKKHKPLFSGLFKLKKTGRR